MHNSTWIYLRRLFRVQVLIILSVYKTWRQIDSMNPGLHFSAKLKIESFNLQWVLEKNHKQYSLVCARRQNRS